jgi:hypothetical protein
VNARAINREGIEDNFMKKLVLLLIGLGSLPAGVSRAADAPRGNLLELHSCALYAGGCIVSSQSTLGGRYMVRAWQFTGGSFAGADLTGLQVAVLQTSSENLALPEAESDEAVVYLPQATTSSQRAALLGWVKSSVPDLKTAKLQSRVLPLRFAKTGAGYAFSAGKSVSIETAPPEACATGACGEALWYEPRTPVTVFTVAVNRSSRVTEPLLKLNWSDSGKRCVFEARFGDSSWTGTQYAGSANLCGVVNR